MDFWKPFFACIFSFALFPPRQTFPASPDALRTVVSRFCPPRRARYGDVELRRDQGDKYTAAACRTAAPWSSPRDLMGIDTALCKTTINNLLRCQR